MWCLSFVDNVLANKGNSYKTTPSNKNYSTCYHNYFLDKFKIYHGFTLVQGNQVLIYI